MLDPDAQPRECVVAVIAALRFAFAGHAAHPSESFDKAEEFVVELEKRFGPIEAPKP